MNSWYDALRRAHLCSVLLNNTVSLSSWENITQTQTEDTEDGERQGKSEELWRTGRDQ